MVLCDGSVSGSGVVSFRLERGVVEPEMIRVISCVTTSCGANEVGPDPSLKKNRLKENVNFKWSSVVAIFFVYRTKFSNFSKLTALVTLRTAAACVRVDGHTACTGHLTLLNGTDDVLVHTVAVLARVFRRKNRTAIRVEGAVVVASFSVVDWGGGG